MTATQIMDEIECLPPVEPTKKWVSKQPLSGTELTALAQRMVAATDPVTAQRLKADLIKGFYGDK